MPTPDLGQQIADLRAVVLRANAPEVMTPAEAADFLAVTTETLYRWRKDAMPRKAVALRTSVTTMACAFTMAKAIGSSGVRFGNG